MDSSRLTQQDIEGVLERNKLALILDKRFPRPVRRALLSALTSGIFLISLAFLALYLIGMTTFEHEYIAILSNNATRMLGLLSIFSALWLPLFALEMFSLSAHFGGLKATLSRTELYRRADGFSFELLSLLFKERRNENLADIAFRSKHASHLLARLGVEHEELERAIKEQGVFIEKSLPLRTDGKALLVLDVATFVYKESEALQEFFFAHGVTEASFFGALDWTERMFREREKSLRSWSRINLSEIPGLAKDWAYGGAYALQSYAQEATPVRFPSLGVRHVEDTTETVLSGSHEPNVLLIGEDTSTSRSVIGFLAERIRLGTSSPVLEGKRIYVLDTVTLTVSNPSKIDFERALLRILFESADAGNIILVIENIAEFLAHADTVGVDIASIFEPYLESDALQVIASISHDSEQLIYGRFPFVKSRFEPIRIPSVSEDELLFVLSYRALEIEARRRGEVFFLFQTLERAAELARSVLQNPSLPEDAIDILESTTTEALRQGRIVVTPELVEKVVTEATGIPVGKVNEKERGELLSLEDTLASMVIGQEGALHAVANALRRARAGLKAGTKPIGSFLFLGPTGVGKTQVARALEVALFDRTDAMHRLDMSEYSGPDALERLIGSGFTDAPGVLEAKVAKAPYGILLIDEFEKSSPEVRNLFLQILDEGFYSNARGKQVTLRNLVIIATSNAGSAEIERASREYSEISLFKSTLIDTLIVSNIFRPELLNRFDDIILFEPLSRENLRQIAELELRKVESRITGARVKLDITDELLDFLVEYGYDPSFGARPMKRVIQETVEKLLSERILMGEITPGSTVRLTRSELESALRG